MAPRVVVVSIDFKGEIETKFFRGLSGVLTALLLKKFFMHNSVKKIIRK